MMNCQEVIDDLSAYLDQELPQEKMLEIQQHLEKCPACKDELAALEKTVLMLSSLEEIIPPASFRRELRQKLEKQDTRKRFSLKALIPDRLPRFNRYAVFPAVCALALLLVIAPVVLNSMSGGGMKMALDKADSAESPQAQGLSRQKKSMELEETGGMGYMSFDGAAPADGLTIKADEMYGLHAGAAAPSAPAVPPDQGVPRVTTMMSLEDGAGAAPEVNQKEAALRSSVNDKVSTAPAWEAAPGEAAAPLTETERKIIKNADLALRVDDYKTAAEAIKQKVQALGGYITAESVNTTDQQEIQNGHLEARVPAARFEEFLSGVNGIGEVSRQDVYSDDVTEEYIDVNSRLKAMRTKEERLLAILSKSGQLSDVLAVENELANTRAQLESLEGRLRYLSNRVEYSTINMNIRQKTIPTHQITATGFTGLMLRMKEAFIQAVNNILRGTGTLLVFIGAAIPYLLVVGLLGGLLWLGLIKLGNKKGNTP